MEKELLLLKKSNVLEARIKWTLRITCYVLVVGISYMKLKNDFDVGLLVVVILWLLIVIMWAIEFIGEAILGICEIRYLSKWNKEAEDIEKANDNEEKNN